MDLRLLVIFSLLTKAASLSLEPPDCGLLDRESCRADEDCVWLDGRKTCVFDLTAKCTDIKKRRDCHSVDKCAWTSRDKCIEEEELVCSNLLTKDQCFAYRGRGCKWLRTNEGSKCYDEEDVKCEDMAQNSRSCRKLEKCQWINEQRDCVPDDLSNRCRNCVPAICPAIFVKCSENADFVVPEGKCCPTCVLKADCSEVQCSTPRCFEGETPVLEPGECCPICRKTCPCAEPDCSRTVCAARLPCLPGEDAVVPPGGCCEECVKRVVPSSCRKAKCQQSLACQIGESVVTEPGECCPVCKKQTCPESASPSLPGQCSTNEDCNAGKGEICYTGFDNNCDEDCGDVTCAGKCVVEEKTEEGFCGGIAGIACPDGFECVDNKGDKCSPNCGGADCSGICIEECPQPAPGVCGKVLSRVQCGRCIYSNRCVAQLAGFNNEECVPFSL